MPRLRAVAPQAAAAPASAPALQDSDPWASTLKGLQPKKEPTTFGGQLLQFANEPLIDFHRRGAGPIESGLEDFVSGLTTPTSVTLGIATLGAGAVEGGLVKLGMEAKTAAATAQALKLSADASFLTKYGFDFGKNTIPQMEMNWNDYRAATNPTDKQKALDRLEEYGTESVLNAIAVGLATRGVAHDFNEFQTTSPKGKAMQHEQYAEGVYNYQEENQIGTAQSRQDIDKYSKMIPDEKRRVAITRNIEAGGDPRILEAQAIAAENNPALKDTAEEYRGAKQLSDTEIEVRDEIRAKLAGDLAHLKHLGLLPEDGGKPNYMPHKWDVEDLDPDTGKPVTKTLVDGDRDMLKKRTFDTIADGEQKGVKPTTKDAVALYGDYHERVSNLIAKHNLAEKLASSYTNDGAPMAAPGHLFPGFTRPRDAAITPEEVENLKASGKFDELLRTGRVYEVEPKPAKPPAMVGEPGLVVRHQELARNDARELEHEPEEHAYMWKQRDYVPSGLSVWRPVSEAEIKDLPNAIVTYGEGPFKPDQVMQPGMKGIPTDTPPVERIPHARIPVYVNPDIAPHLEPMLETTRSKNALIRAFLAVSKETKSDLNRWPLGRFPAWM